MWFTAEVYAKPYAKTTESRGEQSTARSERREKRSNDTENRRRKRIAWQKRRRQMNSIKWWSVHYWKRKRSPKR